MGRNEKEKLEKRNNAIKNNGTLSLDVEDMDFSVRSYNCIKRAGINTIADIIALTREEFAQIRHFNKKYLDELDEKLNLLGLELKE